MKVSEHRVVDDGAVKAVKSPGKKDDHEHPPNCLCLHKKHHDLEICPSCVADIDGKPCSLPNLPPVEYCINDHIEGNVR